MENVSYILYLQESVKELLFASTTQTLLGCLYKNVITNLIAFTLFRTINQLMKRTSFRTGKKLYPHFLSPLLLNNVNWKLQVWKPKFCNVTWDKSSGLLYCYNFNAFYISGKNVLIFNTHSTRRVPHLRRRLWSWMYL